MMSDKRRSTDTVEASHQVHFDRRGEVVPGSRQVKLKDCVDLLSGFAFKSQQFTDDPDDVALVKGENVSQGRVLWDISKRWPLADWDKFEKFQLTVGDVIIAMDRPWVPAGLKWCFIRDHDTKALLVQRCCRLRANPSLMDQTFLRCVVGGPGFESYIKPITTGVNIPHISGKQILDYTFNLPNLPTQRKIAGILSAYDDLIENNLRRIKILEQMAQSLYREWFVHFRFPGHESATFKDSELGRIPEGWEVKKLGQVAKIVMGLSPKGDTYNDQGDGMPLVNGPVEFSERFTKRIKWTSSPTKTCKAGDLVVCVRGSTTGKNVKSDGEYCFGRGVCSISSEHQGFVDQMFANELPTLLGMTSGSTFPSWTGPVLQSHPVILPPKTLVAEFDRIARPMSDEIQKLACKNDNLRRTRDLLLPKLLNGISES
jgi:type I restriction enzyme, S subunit